MLRSLLLSLLAGCETEDAPEPSAEPPDTLRAHIAHLASDDLNGRETGTDDIARAAEYIAETLRGCGLSPVPGADDLFAPYTLYRSGYDLEQTALSVTVDGESTAATPGEDWRPFDFSDPGEVSGEVVFAGYGITAPEYGYDDYAGLDVAGKIVLILRHEPGEEDESSPFDGTASSEHAAFIRKALNAAEHGAIGYLLVTDPLHHEPGDDLRMGGRLSLEPPAVGEGEGEEPLFRAAHITREAAEALVAGSGKSLTALQEALEAGTPASALSIGPVEAALRIAPLAEAEPITERNVVAMVPGASRAEEWVVVGAHYDHIGGYAGPGDTIFNGADDNASGTAGMMELACALARRETPPARSVVFMAYSGEEKGLLGSRAWVAEHGVDGVVFMLNLDMIGRNREEPISIIGDGYGTGVAALVQEAAALSGLEQVELAGADYFGASDHDSFYREDVPFLFFFTGTHEDYHQVGDHTDKLALDRMRRIIGTGRHVVESIADAAVTPRFVHHVGWLGVEIREGVVAAVDADARGGQAGIAVGDRLLRVGEAVVTADDLGPALRGVEPGSEALLALDRGGEEVAVTVQRAKTGYLGIYPGAPSEEQQQAIGIVDGSGVVVLQAVEGGPAAESGLREGDVILQIAGRAVSRRSLTMVLQRIGAGEPVTCLVVRDGERISIALTLGERPER